jgi:threonine synthase
MYRCQSCGHEFDARRIETELLYLCPDCGAANDNQPLTGVLSVVYDMESMRKNLSRERFLNLIPGCPWLYPDLWPLHYKENSFDRKTLQKLSLPSNLLFSVEHNGEQVYILDDTRNPTYSFKDRASVLVALKAIQAGYSELSVASTGNAGSSLAGICARLGLKAHVWVPEQIPQQKLLQIQGYGAQVHIVRASYDMAFDLNRKVSVRQKWYDRNTAYNPLTIEGKKSAAYDIFITTQGHLPDNIIVPVGDGVILGGIFKGFSELLQLGWIERLPKLVAVQAGGSDALARYIRTGQFEFREAHTIADSICAGAPRNLYMAAAAISDSEGQVVVVSDQAIFEAQKECATHWGYLIEPSAAATYAAYNKFKSSNHLKENEKTLLMFTGNGMKDMQAIKNWCKIDKARSVAEWKKSYKLD